MLYAGHLLGLAYSVEQQSTGLSVEGMKAVAGFTPHRPHDGLGAAIGGGDDWRPAPLVVGAPCPADRRRRARADLQRDQIARRARATHSLTAVRVADHVRSSAGRVSRRGVDDWTRGDALAGHSLSVCAVAGSESAEVHPLDQVA